MAPRRVAAALASDDALEDSIRQDMLGGRGADDDQQDDADQGDEQQDDADQGDDQHDDADQGDDQPDDADRGDDQAEPAPRRRAAVREPHEPEPFRLSPEAEARIATAERIAAEAVARSDALMQQFGQPRETPEQEAARLALMTPEQLIDYKLGKALGQHNQTIAQVTFNAQNSADKSSFEGIIAANPQLKRFAANVERKHSDMVRDAARTGAQVPTRNTVLTYMLGERAMELAQKTAPQRRERQRRVERQQARPGSSRSDVSATRRRETTLEQRLENVQL